MAPRHVGNHCTRRDRFGDDPPLLLVPSPPAADDAGNLRAAPNQLRVVINAGSKLDADSQPEGRRRFAAPCSARQPGPSHRTVTLWQN
jgi:hypothetical protein